MAAGSIIVSLLMATGSFESDTARAEKRLKAFQKEAEKAGQVVGAALVAGVVAAVAAFDQLTKSVGDFKDLEETIGASAEDIASLAVAAATAGVSMESVTGATIKLTKGLVGVDDESKAAGAALAALGLSVEDFKRLDPVAQYEAVGKALNGFADGASKTAVAVALFGKSGAEQLRVFKALEEQGGRQVVITQKQIEAADAYADAQAKALAQLKLFAQLAALEALPAVTSLTEVSVEFARSLSFADDAANKLARNSGIRDFADEAAKGIAFVVDQIDLIVRLITIASTAISTARLAKKLADQFDFTEAQAAVDKGMKDINAIIDRQTFGDRLNRNINARIAAEVNPASYSNEGRAPTKIPLAFDGGDSDAGASAKKTLDNRLKEQERIVAAEKELAQTRNKFLEFYNDQNLLSISSYYAARKAISDAATSAQVEAYDREIQALQAFQGQTKKASEREETQGKIDELRARKAIALQQAGETEIELTLRQTVSQDALAKSIAGVNAQLAQMQGELGKAAAINFDSANSGLMKTFSANGNKEAADALAQLRQYTVAQADYSKAAAESNRIVESLRLAEDRVALAQQLGSTTELGALQKVSDARSNAVAQLESIVAAQEAIARASGNPDLIIQAERARFELDRLGASANLVADKVNKIFSDSAADAFTDFITGTKSASEAFKDFANNVIRDLVRMEAQSLATKIFSGDGKSGSGIGGLLASFFGGSKGNGGTSYGAGNVYGDPYAMATGTNYVPYDGFRATLHKGEAVVPRQYNPAAGSSRGDIVNIVNNLGVPARADTTSERQPDGATLKKIILSTIQEDAKRGGPASESLASRFGLRPQLARRGS